MKLTRNFAAGLIALSLGAGSATAQECEPYGEFAKISLLELARNWHPDKDGEKEAQYRIDIAAQYGGEPDNLTCEGFAALLIKLRTK